MMGVFLLGEARKAAHFAAGGGEEGYYGDLQNVAVLVDVIPDLLEELLHVSGAF